MDYKENTQKTVLEVSAMITRIWGKQGNGALAITFSPANQMRAFAAPLPPIDNIPAYQIAVMRPLLWVLHEYIRVFLSDNSLFPSIGSSSSLCRVDSIRAKDIDELNHYIGASVPFTFDEERKKLHGFLFTMVTEFVLFHEFTHIVNGHIDLLKQSSSNGTKLTSEDIQTLELDADACAICEVYHKYAMTMSTDSSIPTQLANEKSIMYCLFFCSFLMMSVISYFSMTLEMLTTAKHPNPYTRCLIAFGSLFASIQATNPALTSSVTESFIEVMQNFMYTYDLVIEDNTKEEFYWTFNPNNISNDYTLYLSKHWNSLRPRLEPYAMQELPPLYVPGK